MKFRKKPVLIEATQLRASAFDNVYPNPEHITGVIYDPVQRCAFIKTLEGTMRADIGDWIITGVMGERYPCKPDIFAMTYEPVAPQAKPQGCLVTVYSSRVCEFGTRGCVTEHHKAANCIGNDPACPCQDGDACHYKDTPTTKAWPIPQAEPKCYPHIEVSLAAGHGYWGVALCVGAQSFALSAEFATLTEADEYAERLRAALGITGDSNAD